MDSKSNYTIPWDASSINKVVVNTQTVSKQEFATHVLPLIVLFGMRVLVMNNRSKM